MTPEEKQTLIRQLALVETMLLTAERMFNEIKQEITDIRRKIVAS